jgi:hypothetical protein
MGKKKMFITIEQLLLNNEQIPQLNELYRKELLHDLILICDVQHVAHVDVITYGLDQRKVIEWLKAKLNQVMERLQRTPLVLAYFTKNKPMGISMEKRNIYAALRLLSEYVEKEWIDLLSKEYE